jgi:hypothetical protein
MFSPHVTSMQEAAAHCFCDFTLASSYTDNSAQCARHEIAHCVVWAERGGQCAHAL